MLTGYLATLPADVLVNAGILSHEVAGVFTKIGVTDGGSSFDPGITEKDISFDGTRCTLKGLTRRVGFKPVLAGKLKEFGNATSGGQIALIEPGASEATVTGTTTITPKPAGALYVAADYILGLRWILECASGGYACVLFPIAKNAKWKLTSKDKDEALIDFEFDAVGDPTVDLGIAPYLIERRTALPA